MNYIKKNTVELFLIILCLTGVIGGNPNYAALILAILCFILLLSQQKYLGIALGAIIGLVGIYLIFALLSDIVKMNDFSSSKSIQFVGIGSLLCLSLLSSSFLLIRKYFH